MPTPDSPVTDDVAAAFAMLLDELEAALQEVNRAGARAFGAGDYAEVERLRQRGEEIGALMSRSQTMADEWALAGGGDGLGRRISEGDGAAEPVPPGRKTPSSAYRVAILRALTEQGGAARTRVVLDRVFEEMSPVFTADDLALLPSGREARWRNTAQWERLNMVKAGLLATKSPTGTWEITDQGRAYLAEHGADGA